MILINKNDSNDVIVTLNEKRQSLTSIFIFQFTNDITKDVILFTTPDISPAQSRYNEFTILEDIVGNEDLYTGIINLPFTGYYSYSVYEVEPTSPQTLDITNALGIVETGKVFCAGDAPIANSFTPTTNYNGAFSPTNIND